MSTNIHACCMILMYMCVCMCVCLRVCTNTTPSPLPLPPTPNALISSPKTRCSPTACSIRPPQARYSETSNTLTLPPRTPPSELKQTRRNHGVRRESVTRSPFFLNRERNLGWFLRVPLLRLVRGLDLPINPPTRKQAIWHIIRKPIKMPNFRPLRFSIIAPAIVGRRPDPDIPAG